MATLILFAALFLCILYGIIAVFLVRGLLRRPPVSPDTSKAFTVIIAARNEERHLEHLLDSLAQLEYPKDLYEIIVVDDRSTDATPEILERYTHRINALKILRVTDNPTDMPHKKNALRTAIASARNEFLAFTDADCIVPRDWLRSLSEQFTDRVGVVAGYSPYRFDRHRWDHSFLRYEEYKNSLLAASAIGLGKGFMCTGRNFAYRKTVFDEVGGFERIKQSISGDDDLFLQLVRRTTAWEVRYMVSPGSVVETQPPASFRQFIDQRIRHISASRYYSRDITAAYAVAHLFLLLIVIMFFIEPFWGLIFLLLRLNLDAIFIARGNKLISEQFGIASFFVNEIALMLYTLLIGPLGFVKKFNWKESAP